MLSEDVRNELARVPPRESCDRLAELSALFHTAGSFHLRGRGEVSVQLDLASSAVARRAFTLLRELEVDSEIRTYRQRAFAQATRYQLLVAGDPAALDVLRRAGVLSERGTPLARPPRQVVGRACCRRAYLRGALLGAGSVSGPRAPHLEVRAAAREGADFLAWLVGLERVDLRVRDRGRFAVAYAKGTEAIADALVLAGVSDAALLAQAHPPCGGLREKS